jgi:hypothetical protein
VMERGREKREVKRREEGRKGRKEDILFRMEGRRGQWEGERGGTWERGRVGGRKGDKV